VGGGGEWQAVCGKEQIGGPVRGIETVGVRNIRMENCGDKQCWRKEENVRKNNKRMYMYMIMNFTIQVFSLVDDWDIAQ
jgi:hypothetical protein